MTVKRYINQMVKNSS